ncbi:hypothetical protein AAY473_020547 [Plecturocebus cupreus]
MIMAHFSLNLPGSGVEWRRHTAVRREGASGKVVFDGPDAQTRFYHIGQAGLKLLSSDDPPTSASQRVNPDPKQRGEGWQGHRWAESSGVQGNSSYKVTVKSAFGKSVSCSMLIAGDAEGTKIQPLLSRNPRTNWFAQGKDDFPEDKLLKLGSHITDFDFLRGHCNASATSTGDLKPLRVQVAKHRLPEKDGVTLCGIGWNAVTRSQLTATSTSWVQAILLLSLLSSWDDRRRPPPPANFCVFSRDGVLPDGPPPVQWPGWSRSPDLRVSFLLPRLECNGTILAHHSLFFWVHVILLPQPPE